MIPWIQVYSNITTHDKTYALAERLKIDQFAAVGIMVSLWAWASVNATDGDVSRYSPTAIAASCGWRKKPAEFYGVLLEVGLLDCLPDGRVAIRNWEQYAALLMDMEERQKKNTRERVKRHRERKRSNSESVTDDECNVTETQSNAPTVPYRTLPNRNSVVGGDARAGEESVDEYVGGRGLSLNDYLGMTEQLSWRLHDLADDIYAPFSLKPPTEADVVKVFTAVRVDEGGVLGVDSERVKLLMYAFEQSSKAGCAGNWNYIDGCLGKLYRRGIMTLEEAEEFDHERGRGEERL